MAVSSNSPAAVLPYNLYSTEPRLGGSKNSSLSYIERNGGFRKVQSVRLPQKCTVKRLAMQAMVQPNVESSLSFKDQGGNFGGLNDRMKSALGICDAAFDVKCRAQTQTVGRPSMSSAPGKEELPMIDNGGSGPGSGTGYKPYYRGDDNGGGTGGGPPGANGGSFSWGDFWLYIFLCYAMHQIQKLINDEKRKMKEKERLEAEGAY